MVIASSDRSQYWQQHIERFQSSGLSGRQYCQQQSLPYHCFVYWRRKLSVASDMPVATTAKHNGLSSASALQSNFVQVHSLPPSDHPQYEGLSLSLPSGVVISHIQDSNLKLISAVLEQL